MINDIRQTDKPCCKDMNLVPSLYVSVNISATPESMPQTGFGLAQCLCVPCKTEWAVFSTPEGFEFRRAKTAKELVVL